MRKSLKRQIAVLTIGTAFLLAGCSGGSQTAGNQAADTQAAQAADDAASGAGGEQGADGAVEETAFSVEDAGGVFEVTLHAECEEQIGKTVEYME